VKRLKIAIVGLTACSGCQLSLLNCEAELPELLNLIDFSLFPLACSPAVIEGDYDAVLVEGCVSMPQEHELLKNLRKRSRYLIAIGTCSVCGGVASIRNGEGREMLMRQVYGDSCPVGESHDPLPLHAVVSVDAVLSGCPPEKGELLNMLTGLLHGVLPESIDYPVCNDCRMNEHLCLLTERGQLCLGLITKGGCGARCPGLGVPCEGCRGPAMEPNLPEARAIYRKHGCDEATVLERMRRFCPEWLP